MKNHFRLANTLIQIELSCLIAIKIRLAMHTNYKAQRI
jgi:hypothetical protein